MQQIEVVRKGELKAGYLTQGMIREKAFESENVVVSQTWVGGGAVSGWHHHGARDLYAFLVSGRLRLEYGSTGGEAVELRQGDFVHIPAGIVHRDVNPETQQELVIVNILVGEGDAVVNVRGPQGEAA